jgi:hypothetical protein
MLATALVIGIGLWVYYLAPSSYLALDINPSIEIKTNRLNQVTSIDPQNEDAKQLLSGYELTDRNLETVIHNIVDRIILAGYIAPNKDNTILITADDSQHSTEISDTVNNIIINYLNLKQIAAQIIPQNISLTSQSIEEAHENFVSVGKMAIINELISNDSTLTIEQLSILRISDLITLAENKNISLAGLFLETNSNDAIVNNEGQTNNSIINTNDVILKIEEEDDEDKDSDDREDEEDDEDNDSDDHEDDEDDEDNDSDDREDDEDDEDNDYSEDRDDDEDDDEDNDSEDREDDDDEEDNDYSEDREDDDDEDKDSDDREDDEKNEDRDSGDHEDDEDDDREDDDSEDREDTEDNERNSED